MSAQVRAQRWTAHAPSLKRGVIITARSNGFKVVCMDVQRIKEDWRSELAAADADAAAAASASKCSDCSGECCFPVGFIPSRGVEETKHERDPRGGVVDYGAASVNPTG